MVELELMAAYPLQLPMLVSMRCRCLECAVAMDLLEQQVALQALQTEHYDCYFHCCCSWCCPSVAVATARCDCCRHSLCFRHSLRRTGRMLSSRLQHTQSPHHQAPVKRVETSKPRKQRTYVRMADAWTRRVLSRDRVLLGLLHCCCLLLVLLHSLVRAYKCRRRHARPQSVLHPATIEHKRTSQQLELQCFMCFLTALASQDTRS